MSQRQFNWMAIGLALVVSIAGGCLVGEEAGASIDPFYANVVAQADRDRVSHNAQIIRDADVTQTLDYGQARAIQEASYNRAD